MRNFWIVPGSEENWKQAFRANGIWGLEDSPLDKVYWLAIAPNDIILFYISGKVKGVIGYGIVRNKFYQNVPLWKTEIQEGRVKWPLRFEFDVEFLLPEDSWKDEKISVPGGGGFRQPLIPQKNEEAEKIVLTLNPTVSMDSLRQVSIVPPVAKTEAPSPTHEELKKLLLQIGKLQGYVANCEYPMGTERLDVVWRRLPESVPTFAFEVQVGGDIYHAIGKLKHAHDIWNSRIFLVALAETFGEFNKLLSGTFHEIQPFIRFIETEKILSLHQSKQNIYQLEKDLGLIP